MILYCTLWVLIGLLSGIQITYNDHCRGIDLTVSDIIWGFIFSVLLGPILSIFTIYFLISTKGVFDKVLIKGKKYKK